MSRSDHYTSPNTQTAYQSLPPLVTEPPVMDDALAGARGFEELSNAGGSSIEALQEHGGPATVAQGEQLSVKGAISLAKTQTARSCTHTHHTHTHTHTPIAHMQDTSFGILRKKWRRGRTSRQSPSEFVVVCVLRGFVTGGSTCLRPCVVGPETAGVGVRTLHSSLDRVSSLVCVCGSAQCGRYLCARA